MTPRQEAIALFSTFVRFEGDRFGGWLADGRLRRSMKARLAKAPELNERGWTQFWHGRWHARIDEAPTDRDRLLARSHLMAYLQESCFWAARKTASAFDRTSLTVADAFQGAIAEVERVLKGFDPERGTGLKSYASVIFGNAIRDRLRQQREVDVCTPWALLRKVSQKRLTEALQAAGWNEADIARRSLAWSCFKTLYVPGADSDANTPPKVTRQLQRPSREMWGAIANLYNSRRLDLGTGEPSESPEEMAAWLGKCAEAVRAYLYPDVASLNAPSGNDESGGEWLDRVADGERDSLLAAAIDAEAERDRKDRQTQMQSFLLEAIAGLPEEGRSLLQFYYRDDLRQQEIAERLQIKQYTVSRRLTKVRQTVLKALAAWSEDVLHMSLTPEVLDSISTTLEAWLETTYAGAEDPDALTVVERS
ncbi:MAG: sigma-70 family RNA polymerase sigma factor [Cyanobacteria bacterium J06639_1]